MYYGLKSSLSRNVPQIIASTLINIIAVYFLTYTPVYCINVEGNDNLTQ